MKKQHYIALAQVTIILAIYIFGVSYLAILHQSKILFILWAFGLFPVFWLCWKLAVLAEEEVKNEK